MERARFQAMLHDMLLARRFEERAAEEYTRGNIAGFLHLYPGEEAVAVGVLHAADASDYVVSTYRERGDGRAVRAARRLQPGHGRLHAPVRP